MNNVSKLDFFVILSMLISCFFTIISGDYILSLLIFVLLGIDLYVINKGDI